MNHKKVYRLYRAAKLAVRRRKKAQRPAERQHLHTAIALNAVWSMDFVSDALANGRRLKCLTIADDFSHECIDIMSLAFLVSAMAEQTSRHWVQIFTTRNWA